MTRFSPLLAFAFGALVLCGCDNRKRKPDPTMGRVTGLVLCADTAKPARFAYVTLVPQTASAGQANDSDPFASVGNTHTDLDGRFTLEAIPPGQYFAMATLDGYQDPARSLDFARLEAKATDTERAADAIAQWKDYLVPVKIDVQRTSDISITIQRAAEIVGTVSYDDSSPAIGTHFRLYRKSSGTSWATVGTAALGGWSIDSVSDSHGRFFLRGLPAGEYRVCALLPTSSEENTLSVCLGNVLRPRDSTAVHIGDGEQLSSLEIVVPLSGLHTVAGSATATSDGHTIRHGTVQLLYADDGTLMRSLSLDQDDGLFYFDFVPEGRYILRVLGAGDPNENRGSKPASGKASPPTLYRDKESALDVFSDIEGVVVTLDSALQKTTP